MTRRVSPWAAPVTMVVPRPRGGCGAPRRPVMGTLRDKMEGDLKLKGLSPNTRKTYLLCAASFVRHYGKPPARMGRIEVRDYLLHLVLSINSPQRDSRTIRRPDTVLNRPPSAGILPTLAAPPAPPVHHRDDRARHQRAHGAPARLPAGRGPSSQGSVHRSDRAQATPVHYRLRRFLRLAQDRLPPPKASAG
jgi:hypothetical protein